MPLVTFSAEERERLLALLLRDGILYASEKQPVRSRDGKSARWMLDSLSFSLRPEGSRLAGRALLDLLGRFEGRQVATYGITAIPLLSACVAESSGEINGLLVRKERKPYGSSKKIEGRIDPLEPTILIDDSIASGTNVLEGIAALEAAGIWVEGVICLVRFGYYGGFGILRERGYHVKAVFDIFSDVMERMPDEDRLIRNPTKIFPALTFGDESLPEGLAPPELARRVIESYLREGKLPRAPQSLNGSYDSSGGVWVSLRERKEIYSRPARDGFWHFPDDPEGDGPWQKGKRSPPFDLTLAAAKTATALPAGQDGLDLLARCGLAVTFFSALEEVRPGALDNDIYGIVVRSRERPGKMGGALPRMPGITSAWRQFEHARRKNAGLLSFEPYDLFRHRVEKVVESGMAWQRSGVPRPVVAPPIDNVAATAPICRYALALVLAHLGLGPQPPGQDLELEGLDTLFLSVYLKGHLRGCMGSKITGLAEDLENLARLACQDSRFSEMTVTKAEEVAVTLAFLHEPLSLGQFSPAEVMDRVRLGEQALMVYQGERLGLLLPSVAASMALDREAFALEVIDKAGITRPPYFWRRFECSAWLAQVGEAPPRRLVGALPRPQQRWHLDTLAEAYLLFLCRMVHDRGDAYFFYRPHRDRLAAGLDMARRAHLAWVLTRALRWRPSQDLQQTASHLREALLSKLDEEGGIYWLQNEGEASSVAELAFLLLALVELTERSVRENELAGHLATSLWASIGTHGRIETHRNPEQGGDAYQDFFPGQVLLALARASASGLTQLDQPRLEKAFRFYRHRFWHHRHFGQFSWWMQAFAAGSRLLPTSALPAFVREIAEEALHHQHEDGSFSSSLQPEGPGYTSALFLEGLAAARRLSRDRGDDPGWEIRLAMSLDRGIAYLDRLTVNADQAALLPNPEWAIGGVRHSETRDEVRIDFVQHALSVLLEELEGGPSEIDKVLAESHSLESTT